MTHPVTSWIKLSIKANTILQLKSQTCSYSDFPQIKTLCVSCVILCDNNLLCSIYILTTRCLSMLILSIKLIWIELGPNQRLRRHTSSLSPQSASSSLCLSTEIWFGQQKKKKRWRCWWEKGRSPGRPAVPSDTWRTQWWKGTACQQIIL